MIYTALVDDSYSDTVFLTRKLANSQRYGTKSCKSLLFFDGINANLASFSLKQSI